MVAFVTGAARGIGFGIAKALAREGAAVVLADLRAERSVIAVEAMKERIFFVFPHPESRAYVEARHERIVRDYERAPRYIDRRPRP